MITDGMPTKQRLLLVSHLVDTKRPSEGLKQVVMGFFQILLEENGMAQKINKPPTTPVKTNRKVRKRTPVASAYQ
jgi:hypothetical protein